MRAEGRACARGANEGVWVERAEGYRASQTGLAAWPSTKRGTRIIHASGRRSQSGGVVPQRTRRDVASRRERVRGMENIYTHTPPCLAGYLVEVGEYWPVTRLLLVLPGNQRMS